MKFLIVGLGNPGKEYENTRHNIGFQVLDHIAMLFDVSFEEARHVNIAFIKHKGRSFYLLKPNTYMNLSGKAVNYWLQYHKIEFKNLLVITDDIALPFGALRLRSKGSDGGHNGLKNIAAVMGRSDYSRLKFGVGSDFPKGKQADYVLDEWTLEQKDVLPDQISQAAEAVLSFGYVGITRTMSRFNRR